MDTELRDRFISLETSFNEFKEAHKINSAQRHKENREKLNKIFNWLERLPCETIKVKVSSNTKRINWLYFVFIVVVVGGIVLGIWVKQVMAQ